MESGRSSYCCFLMIVFFCFFGLSRAVAPVVGEAIQDSEIGKVTVKKIKEKLKDQLLTLLASSEFATYKEVQQRLKTAEQALKNFETEFEVEMRAKVLVTKPPASVVSPAPVVAPAVEAPTPLPPPTPPIVLPVQPEEKAPVEMEAPVPTIPSPPAVSEPTPPIEVPVSPEPPSMSPSTPVSTPSPPPTPPASMEGMMGMGEPPTMSPPTPISTP